MKTFQQNIKHQTKLKICIPKNTMIKNQSIDYTKVPTLENEQTPTKRLTAKDLPNLPRVLKQLNLTRFHNSTTQFFFHVKCAWTVTETETNLYKCVSSTVINFQNRRHVSTAVTIIGCAKYGHNLLLLKIGQKPN